MASSLPNDSSTEAVAYRVDLLVQAFGDGVQNTLAARIGVGRSNIQNVLSPTGPRRGVVSRELAIRLADYTGASIDWLYFGLENNCRQSFIAKLRELPMRPPKGIAISRTRKKAGSA